MSYQVFLSFKNTDNGHSTPDSEIGEKLYVYLTQKGIKVFFSNVSLLEFGEAAYKDAIDDALDEVNIMLVIGSSPEYLTSKWCNCGLAVRLSTERFGRGVWICFGQWRLVFGFYQRLNYNGICFSS